MRQAVFRVRWLESRECRQRLREAVDDVDGVGWISVDVNGGAVDVEYDERDAAAGTIAARIAEAGYHVVG